MLIVPFQTQGRVGALDFLEGRFGRAGFLGQGNGHVVGRVQRCADEGASGTELLDCLRNVAKLIVTASVDQHVAAGAEELHLGVPENVEIPVDSLADYAISVVSVAKELGHTRCLCLKG